MKFMVSSSLLLPIHAVCTVLNFNQLFRPWYNIRRLIAHISGISAAQLHTDPAEVLEFIRLILEGITMALIEHPRNRRYFDDVKLPDMLGECLVRLELITVDPASSIIAR